MARVHVFGDEAGNFDFSAKEGASRFFLITTATFFDDRQACERLQALRYELGWEGVDHDGPFHATTDARRFETVYSIVSPRIGSGWIPQSLRNGRRTHAFESTMRDSINSPGTTT